MLWKVKSHLQSSVLAATSETVIKRRLETDKEDRLCAEVAGAAGADRTEECCTDCKT